MNDLEEIKQKLGKRLTEYSELQETREQLLQDIGETRNELEKLSSDNDLVDRQNELESQKQELKLDRLRLLKDSSALAPKKPSK